MVVTHVTIRVVPAAGVVGHTRIFVTPGFVALLVTEGPEVSSDIGVKLAHTDPIHRSGASGSGDHLGFGAGTAVLLLWPSLQRDAT